MIRSLRLPHLLFLIWGALLITPETQAQQQNLTTLLAEGKLTKAAQGLTQELGMPNANTSQLSFRLGVVQLLQAIEKLGQTQYEYGLMNSSRISMPLFRLPLPNNPVPKQLNAEQTRKFISTFLKDIKLAETTLAVVKPSDDKLTLDLAQVRIDLNSDGMAGPDESIFRIINVINGTRTEAQNSDSLQVCFDDGDVLWLRGYCNVLAAFCEIILAHDWTDLFERSAHLVFPGAETPYTWLLQERSSEEGFTIQNGLDVIALIHSIRFEVTDRDGMLRALHHLEQVTDLSRESWELINAETDNDREWLPNPRQSAALGPQLRITREMQSQWNLLLDEVDSILSGDTLVPFWRGVPGSTLFNPNGPAFNPKFGINVRKIFTEPQTFDLVLWIQGTGLHTFLETGPITRPDRWRQITSAFQGQFMMFALWIN